MRWKSYMEKCLHGKDKVGYAKKNNVWYITVERPGKWVLYDKLRGDREKLCRNVVKTLAKEGILSAEDLANAILTSR